MAQIRPFAGIRYSKKHPDISAMIAPPYDVLDEPGKAKLQAKHPNNIVNIDLPFMPPKSVGPDAVYEQASATLQAWLATGVLVKDSRPALYPYCQTYEHGGKTFRRRAFFALVKLTPFGQDVIPHEKTYQGPIEDRLKLMRATQMQLSPIFGLFSDPRNEVTGLLYKNAGRPELSGTMDGVKNDLWSVIDAEVEIRVVDMMKARPIYIADGHHRYTTALQFQREAEQAAGGRLPPGHPANYCMFVLVGMQDPGLLILPTHRLIGGLEGFSIDAFRAAVGGAFDVTESRLTPDRFDEHHQTNPNPQPHTFGLYDGRSRKLYNLHLKDPDVLKPLEPTQSDAWRRLDVAILQRYLLDEILQPKFAAGKELAKGYTADAAAVAPQVDGVKYQIALMLRPTPLHALEELGRHGEVMPQKSTYFSPKLATGMVINPLKELSNRP
ncbi:MAG TPA: DUF1015 domain-containing protein [Tepidisphaeraceae bacterium]|nr:DUF1015 domain-containing protein [Tepidisphaeraceae bacterium]